MRIALPSSTICLGDVQVLGVQQVLELDAANPSSQSDQGNEQQGHAFSNEELGIIQSRTAIVVPCKGEDLDQVRNVWRAIPATSLIISVSATQEHEYTREKQAMDDFCRDTGRTGISIHQHGRQLGIALRKIGLESLTDDNGNVHKGKGEALIIGILLAAIAPAPADKTNGHSNSYNGYYKYIGFIDADNLAPGSVSEYCKAFSAGFCMAKTQDAMVRLNWASKAMAIGDQIRFRSQGRSSRVVNQCFNRILKAMIDRGTLIYEVDERAQNKKNMGFDHICTGNAGEHAMTMTLALKLQLASGYAFEPFHLLDIFDRFAGPQKSGSVPGPAGTAILSATSQNNAAEQNCEPGRILQGAQKGFKVQIFQIRTINSHFHDTSKGRDHVLNMYHQALGLMLKSHITMGLPDIKESISQVMGDSIQDPVETRVYPALEEYVHDIDVLRERLKDLLTLCPR
ncbi:mannosyl-3-phosphoglycerate synthase [Diaporthe sp. PMI_573]|nr:mannosyl-3-phosphoglycerate synthase [Diaporthaceae sp. PMI_573]